MKTAIIVLSDPKSGSDDVLGRLFNALASAYDFKQAGEQVEIIFQGAGTRWVGVLNDTNHPAYELFKEVEDKVAGVSCGCADVFGATEEAERSAFDLIKDNPVPGTSGLPSIRKLTQDGFNVLIF